jgi:hypothetical protein
MALIGSLGQKTIERKVESDMGNRLPAPLAKLKANLVEIYRRFDQAYDIFRRRLMSLAIANACIVEVHCDVESRNGADLGGAEVVKLTRVLGNVLRFTTGSTPHRAGIPAHGNYRDIFSMAFFTVCTGIGVSAGLLFDADAGIQ